MSEQYLQVGVMALRAPDGEFMPSEKLYIRIDENKDIGDYYRNIAKALTAHCGHFVDGTKPPKAEASA